MKRAIYPLYAPADEGKVQPILTALKAKGVAVRDPQAKAGKGDALLLFLSGNFSAEGPEADDFFRLNVGRELVIPVNLDNTMPPETLQNALMARHTLNGAKYGPEELADRIAKAVKGDGKNRLPLILSIAAAVILLAVGAVVLIRALAARPVQEDEPAATAVSTAEPAIPQNVDLSREELEKVFELIIVGDSFNHFNGDEEWMVGAGNARVGADYVANRGFMDGEAHWYSAADGHEYAMCDWGNLDFLPYMKNLTLLTLVNVKGTLPDLSSLPKLNCVELFDCDITDISGVKGGDFVYFSYKGPIIDFSPLNDCRQLGQANIDLYGSGDMRGLASFSPTTLRELNLMRSDGADGPIDLSGLKNCRKLERAEFQNLPLTDLSFLSGTTVLGALALFDLPQLTSLDGLKNVNRALLGNVNIDNCNQLRDLSALSACVGLGELSLEDCPVADLSFLAGCKSLKTLSLRSMSTLRSLAGLESHRTLKKLELTGLPNLRDVTALGSCTALTTVNLMGTNSLSNIDAVASLPKLRELTIYGAALNDVNFLWNVQDKEFFSFGIAEVPDWSGLAAIEKYSYLNITDRNGSALPYLQSATVTDLEIWNRGGMGNQSEGMDLSLLPRVTNELKLHCVRSLEGLDQPDIRRLIVDDCPYLTSLSGLEKSTRLGSLSVYNCPRLNDWSALTGRSIYEIHLEGLFSLPDFGNVVTKNITLTTIFDLKDLSCFENYKQDWYSISLMDVDGVTDLSPLYHLKGKSLQVPAHLMEQAQAMVDSGLLEAYEVTYPEGWWQPIEPDITITSLEEIEGLPSALAARIKKLTLAGDAIVPEDGVRVEEDYDSDPPALYVRDDWTDTRTPVEPGTLTDLGPILKLTGLEELTIYAQPQLTSLEGIQGLSDLRALSIQQCPALTDASAVFTVQSLEELRLRFTGISSLQGIQNLYALRQLDLNSNPVEDLTPIASCPSLEEAALQLPLMTYDELKALPEAVRLYLDRGLTFAGNYVFEGGPWWFEEDWSSDPVRLYLHNNDTDERLPLTEGPVRNMAELRDLVPNVGSLELFGQPLTSLDGIEGFERLWAIDIHQCHQLADFTALWKNTALQLIEIRNTPLQSIRGIENMRELTALLISGTNVKDFSPLMETDLSYCVSEGSDARGFDIALDVTDAPRLTAKDYEVLSHIPAYRALNMNNAPAREWLAYVMDKQVFFLSCHNCSLSNEQLKAFAEAHPELEQIQLAYNPRVTDLTPLLGLEHLREVYVSPDMEEAVASLGDGYGFDLRIED